MKQTIRRRRTDNKTKWAGRSSCNATNLHKNIQKKTQVTEKVLNRGESDILAKPGLFRTLKELKSVSYHQT